MSIIGALPYTLTNGTTADANAVQANFTYIVSQVNANVQAAIAAAVLAAVPVGIVAKWSGSIASIPAPWQLCDGTNGTEDLRDKFIVGAGNTYAVGCDRRRSSLYDHGGRNNAVLGADPWPQPRCHRPNPQPRCHRPNPQSRRERSSTPAHRVVGYQRCGWCIVPANRQRCVCCVLDYGSGLHEYHH